MGEASPRALVLDTGALLALEAANPWLRALLRKAYADGSPIVIPATALAQAWRDGRRQTRLASLLAASNAIVAVLDELTAKAAGALCGRAGTSDVIDASVVVAARAADATVITSYAADLRRLDPGLQLESI